MNKILFSADPDINYVGKDTVHGPTDEILKDADVVLE